MATSYRTATVLLAAVVASTLLVDCSAHSTSSNASASETSAPPNGLCAFIQSKTAAETRPGNLVVLFAPLQPARGEIAGCEFSSISYSLGDLFSGMSEISLAPTIQGGVNAFTKLRANASISLSDINGNQVLWNPNGGILYLRFDDRNTVYGNDSAGTDSILTVNDQAGRSTPITAVPSTTPPSWLVAFAEHIADEISASHVYSTSLCPQCQNWRSNPMLIDDKGRELPNPLLVVDVYALLLADDMQGLGGVSSRFAVVPYANQKAALDDIARSMTVHADCGEYGCIYPDFVITGWNSAAARADGIRLAIDPAKVSNPTFGHDRTVYPSEFDSQVDMWEGTIPPGDD